MIWFGSFDSFGICQCGGGGGGGGGGGAAVEHSWRFFGAETRHFETNGPTSRLIHFNYSHWGFFNLAWLLLIFRIMLFFFLSFFSFFFSRKCWDASPWFIGSRQHAILNLTVNNGELLSRLNCCWDLPNWRPVLYRFSDHALFRKMPNKNEVNW